VVQGLKQASGAIILMPVVKIFYAGYTRTYTTSMQGHASECGRLGP